MDELDSLSHSKWECKYHVVFIPKCRRKTLYEQLRRYLGELFRKLAEQKESRIEEGHHRQRRRGGTARRLAGCRGCGSRSHHQVEDCLSRSEPR